MYRSKEERQALQDELILHFARYCWINRVKFAPSGRTWAEVFEKKSGINLYEYKEQKVNERNGSGDQKS